MMNNCIIFKCVHQRSQDDPPFLKGRVDSFFIAYLVGVGI